VSLVRPAADVPEGVAAVDVDVYEGGSAGTVSRRRDLLTMEEPLEIRIVHGPAHERAEMSVAVTMRTPGDDVALALGFLHGEAVIASMDDVVRAELFGPEDPVTGYRNIVLVELAPEATFDADALTRNVYTTSSCGVCGKASLDAVRVRIPDRGGRDTFRVERTILGTLPERLREAQAAFAHTGGLHASGAFDADGRIVAVAEDVGRHNALDKLVGRFLADGRLPMSELGLVFSGRSSFELVQKAAMAGCPFIAAIGPPSSLAVELAAEQRMTLVGFLRADRFNAYTLPGRIDHARRT
jgi:FdhD protein